MDIIIKHNSGVIEENFTEAKEYIQEQLNAYKGVVFTEDTKKDAKETIANLRKDKKALQDRIKDVKKEYMKPFEDFYAKATELINLYDEPIEYINAQVNAFEEKRKAEKIEAIKEIYLELIPEEEWQAVLPFNKIFSPKWGNATTSAKSIREDIMRYKEDAKTAYTAIKAMASDKEAEALAMYNRTLNLNECMDYLNRYEQQKKEVLERERQREQREAEERIRREERERIEQEQKAAQAVEQAREEAKEEARAETIEAFIPEDTEESSDYTYMIKLNADSKKKLEMFMDSVGIEYFCM